MRWFVLMASATLVCAMGGAAAADPAYRAEDVVNFFTKSQLGATRGICVGTAEQCKEPKFDLLVTFALNSDQLTSEAEANLKEFAKVMVDPRLASRHFEIDGHTDARGSEGYNIGLSERRADAVVAFLEAQGVDKSRLTAKGFGKTQPRVPDPFDPANRRVETRIIVVKP